jgi:hypothetical protein
MIFGPTPDVSLAPFSPNVRILRSGLPCEPCWFRDRFGACASRIDCLKGIDIQSAIREISSLRGCLQ